MKAMWGATLNYWGTLTAIISAAYFPACLIV